MRSRRVMDWRFLVALTVLIATTYLVYVGINAVQENDRKGRRIDALISEVQQGNQERREATRSANAQRKVLLDQQADLMRQIKQLQHGGNPR